MMMEARDGPQWAPAAEEGLKAQEKRLKTLTARCQVLRLASAGEREKAGYN
jgi:hypothetical protein